MIWEQTIGFDAYGVSEMPDPIAHSIKVMLDHIHEQDERIKSICNTLERLDSNFQKFELTELKKEDFQVVEESDETSAPCVVEAENLNSN